MNAARAQRSSHRNRGMARRPPSTQNDQGTGVRIHLDRRDPRPAGSPGGLGPESLDDREPLARGVRRRRRRSSRTIVVARPFLRRRMGRSLRRSAEVFTATVAVLAILSIQGCATGGNSGPGVANPSTSPSASALGIWFNWASEGSVIDFSGSEATIVRAAYESWYLSAGAATVERAADAAYPGFDAALTKFMRESVEMVRALDRVHGTYRQSIVERRPMGGGVIEYDICADYRGIRYDGFRTAEPSGMTVQIEMRGRVRPPRNATGPAERPSSNMFGSWRINDIGSTPGKPAFDRCWAWSRGLSALVARGAESVAPGWPR